MGNRMRSIWALVALCVMATVAGCGSGTSLSSSPSPSGTKAATFESSEWGFTLDYPAQFVKIEPTASPAGGSGLLYQVYFADPTGAKSSGGSALDGLSVSVHSMSRTARPGDLKKFRGDFENMARELAGKLNTFKIVQPFEIAALGGRPALKGTYTHKIDGSEVATVAYLVPKDDRVYWVTAQASRQTWPAASRELGASVATLRFK
jgi:hypothetical protein